MNIVNQQLHLFLKLNNLKKKNTRPILYNESLLYVPLPPFMVDYYTANRNQQVATCITPQPVTTSRLFVVAFPPHYFPKSPSLYYLPQLSLISDKMKPVVLLSTSACCVSVSLLFDGDHGSEQWTKVKSENVVAIYF